MKRLVLINVVFLMSLGGKVMADCNTPPEQNLSTLLEGNTVCVSNGSDWDAQEYHSGSSGNPDNLIDWKSGPRDPSKGKKELPNTNPTDPVGMWAINNNGTENATITYTYEPNANYTNTVHDNLDGTYSFCNDAGIETVATIVAGQGACQ